MRCPTSPSDGPSQVRAGRAKCGADAAGEVGRAKPSAPMGCWLPTGWHPGLAFVCRSREISPTSSRQTVPALGELEPPDALGDGAGECGLLMSEHWGETEPAGERPCRYAA